MRKSPLSLLAVAFVVSTRAGAADPTARDLIALAPVVSSADGSVKSLEFAGYMAPDGKITRTFRALYRAPNHFAILLSDGASGLPLTYLVDRKMLIYDPVRPELVVYNDVSESWAWDFDDGKPSWGFGHKFWGRDASRLVVDFKAIFGSPDEDGSPTRDTVVKTGPAQFTLIQKRKKLYVRSRVDLTRSCPFTTLEFAESPDADPYCCIDKVVVNGELNAAEFAFPSKERLAGVVNVREVNADTLRNEFEAMSLVLKMYSVRDDLYKPAPSRGLIGPAIRSRHVARIQENDKAVANLFKELIPAGPAHTLAGRPAKKDDPDTIRQTNLETIRHHFPKFPFKVRLQIK